MQARKFLLIILLLIFLLPNISYIAQAASGLPNSAEFGYGANLATSGQQISQALALAPGMGIDWIAVNFDWARLWPSPESEPDLATLFGIISSAQKSQINILLSITNPPTWALTPDGPDTKSTTSLILYIVSRYPDTVLSVELFPGANTATGWGTIPNPDAYIGMIQNVRNALAAQNLNTLVIPGLSVLSASKAPTDIEDIAFLKKFYDADLATPVVGLYYQDMSGQPFSEPTQSEPSVLRHYELVRNFMLQNNHRTDLIWITGFSWPVQLLSAHEQALWVYEAYKLLKAQLYIGAAFFNYLNPPTPELGNSYLSSLVLADGSLHPASNQIRKVSSMTGEILDTSSIIPQTQKGIMKKLIRKTITKRPSS